MATYEEPKYLGDGVYASFDPAMPAIVLTAGHHNTKYADHTLFLDETVLPKLEQYINWFYVTVTERNKEMQRQAAEDYRKDVESDQRDVAAWEQE